MKVLGTTLSIQANDPAQGPQQDPAEAYATNTSDHSNTPEHQVSHAEVQVEGTFVRPSLQKTSSSSTSHQPLIASPTAAPAAPLAATPKSRDRPKTIAEEFVEMKRNLLETIQSMERFGIALHDASLVTAQEASVESVKRSTNDLLHITNRDRPVSKDTDRARGPKAGGRKYSRPFFSRRPNWNLKARKKNTAPSFHKLFLLVACDETDGNQR